MEFSLNNVHGDTIDLHGAHCSFSLIPIIMDSLIVSILKLICSSNYSKSKMSDNEQARDEIEEIAKEDEPVQEAVDEVAVAEATTTVVKGMKIQSKSKTESQNNE